MLNIDLNCDMGESFGQYSIGQDEELMRYVSSVNIACGFHGGDAGVMRKTAILASKNNLAIGAHPGYPDLQGFGRRDMHLSPDEIYDIVLYQIGALMTIVKASTDTTLHHVKPHGALYNTAAKDKSVAGAIAHAVRDADPSLVLIGLSGSHLITEGVLAGLKTASEVFSDRTYQDDGTLTPRSHANALLTHPDDAAQQVLHMVRNKQAVSVSGKNISVKADTVCIHGDSPHALSFAKAIVKILTHNHVSIKKA